MAEQRRDPLRIGPFPLGVDTVSDPKSRVFQPATQPGDALPRLTKAENLDLDRSGFVRSRQGRRRLRTLTRGHSVASVGGNLYYSDGGTIYRYTGAETDEVVVSGLDPQADVSYAEFGWQVYWSNGTECGRIVSGRADLWGLSAAYPPVLMADAGALRPGSYLVVTAPLYHGIEGGSWGASRIELTQPGGILVTPTGIDERATGMAVYCSDPGGDELFLALSVAAGAPAVIAQAPDNLSPFRGLVAFPPPPGHFVRAWKGWLLVASESTLFFSEPGGPHRFHVDQDFQSFAGRIVLLEPLDDGFYLAVEDGPTYWFSGSDPRKLSRSVASPVRAAEGQAARVAAHRLPWLQLAADVVVPVWATEDGPAAGLPGGSVRFPADGRVALNPSRRATVAYAERPGIRNLVMSLRERSGDAVVAIGGQFTMSATRGGVPIE